MAFSEHVRMNVWALYRFGMHCEDWVRRSSKWRKPLLLLRQITIRWLRTSSFLAVSIAPPTTRKRQAARARERLGKPTARVVLVRFNTELLFP